MIFPRSQYSFGSGKVLRIRTLVNRDLDGVSICPKMTVCGVAQQV